MDQQDQQKPFLREGARISPIKRPYPENADLLVLLVLIGRKEKIMKSGRQPKTLVQLRSWLNQGQYWDTSDLPTYGGNEPLGPLRFDVVSWDRRNVLLERNGQFTIMSRCEFESKQETDR